MVVALQLICRLLVFELGDGALLLDERRFLIFFVVAGHRILDVCERFLGQRLLNLHCDLRGWDSILARRLKSG